MASRKQQKEEARQARLEAERAAQANKARNRRLQVIGGVVVAAVAIAAVLIAVSTSGGKSGGIAKGKQATALTSQVNSLLAGIPQSGTTLGDPKAKYTLTFFGDLQCPICKAFATGENLDGVTGGFPQFVKDQVRTGKAKIVYRSFCTATCNDYSNAQSIFNNQQTAAYAAGKQGKFWDYAELFYRQQGAEGSGYVTSSFIDKIADEIPGLDVKTWQSDRGDPSLLSQVQTDEQAASSDKLQGTPSLIITGPKGSAIVAESTINYGDLVSSFKAVT